MEYIYKIRTENALNNSNTEQKTQIKQKSLNKTKSTESSKMLKQTNIEQKKI
jgi:hypothetical protein